MMPLFQRAAAGVISALVSLALVTGLGGLAVGLSESETASLQDNATQDLLKLQGSTPVVQNWKCGCPDDSPTQKGLKTHPVYKKFPRFPTRCLKDNWLTGGPNPSYAPVNDDGKAYPTVPYPPEYPFEIPLSVSNVPFPGWPKGRTAESSDNVPAASWTNDQRKKYKEDYLAVAPAPRSFGQDALPDTVPFKKGRKTWSYWQIHHILEQQYGGESSNNNLVPVYSYSNKKSRTLTNLHNEFTQWWEHITVDRDVLRAKSSNRAFKEFKDKLKKCTK